MKINWKILLRKIHYWGSIVIAIPVVIVIASGLLLLLKKQMPWIQPETKRGSTKIPQLSFSRILEIAAEVPQAQIKTWEDIDRLDVRPTRGVIKIRSHNHWEIQIDHQSGELLQVAYRRSDLIESIHDGSFFHEYVKTGLFLPSAIILLVLWITGMYLFLLPFLWRRKRRRSP